MEDPVVQKMDRLLQDFGHNRELRELELLKLRDQTKLVVDEIFGKLIKSLNPDFEETDDILESRIKEMKRQCQRKKEISNIREKLSPVLQILNST